MDKSTRINSPRLIAGGLGSWSGTLEDLITSPDTEAVDYFLATRHGDADVEREAVYDLITSVEDLEVILDDPNVTIDTDPKAVAVALEYADESDALQVVDYMLAHPLVWGPAWYQITEEGLNVTPVDTCAERFTVKPGQVLVVHTQNYYARPTFWVEDAEAFHRRYQPAEELEPSDWITYLPR